MALVKNFTASTSLPNRVDLNWDLPEGFAESADEIIVTKTQTHFPMELYDTSTTQCMKRATDPRPIEVFRGSIIVGSNESAISVVDQVITDTSANFTDNLKGRLLRDSNSKVFVIASNTTNTITVEGEDSPTAGRYIVLAHFPSETSIQQNFEFDIRTTASIGSISNLVQVINGTLQLVNFTTNELATLVFKDANDERFIISSNTSNTINFYQKYSFNNDSLVSYSYNSISGVVQFAGAVDLSAVKEGHRFMDSSGILFSIDSVDDSLNTITLGTGLLLDDSAPLDALHGAVSIVPRIGVGMSVLNSFFDSAPFPYVDTYKTEQEAAARQGTGLLDDQFYYYTAFSKTVGTNVAQADFSTIESLTSTQAVAISTKDTDFGNLLYRLWPTLHQELDETGDLEDLMRVFGFQLNEIHSLIKTYELQNSHKVLHTALQPLSEQTGLPSVGFSVGADTLRRISEDLITAWKLKGSKEGIALFIRILTTWDITNGTGDIGGSIEDFLPNVSALRFFDPNLGSLNTRLTETDPFTAGGRFAKSLPGVVIPGFFTFREFVVNLPDIALYIGSTEAFSVGDGTTVITDSSNSFGLDDSLVGNFILPNTEEVNDIFEIIANTSTTITVRGIVNNRTAGGDYAVLSPLNKSRFIILNSLLPIYIPFGTRAGFRFVC